MKPSLPVVLALLVARSAVAGQSGSPNGAPNGRAIDGSPAPAAPEVITRDAAGRPTIHAIKLTEPLRLDGTLDEELYQRERPFGGFIQVAPKAGAPSTERTDVWVMFDAVNIYVAARCFDRAPPREWVANEFRRDTAQLRQN